MMLFNYLEEVLDEHNNDAVVSQGISSQQALSFHYRVYLHLHPSHPQHDPDPPVTEAAWAQDVAQVCCVHRSPVHVAW